MKEGQEAGSILHVNPPPRTGTKCESHRQHFAIGLFARRHGEHDAIGLFGKNAMDMLESNPRGLGSTWQVVPNVCDKSEPGETASRPYAACVFTKATCSSLC